MDEWALPGSGDESAKVGPEAPWDGAEGVRAGSEAADLSPLNVLLVLASSGWGGTEKAFVDLANSLAPRCNVSVAIPDDAVYRSRFSEAVRVRSLRRGSRRNPSVLVDLSRTIRELSPDVVHTHAARATEMVYWISRFRRLRHIATKHNTRSRRVFGRVRWVTAVSEAARASIAHPGSVEVVYNGVEAAERLEADELDAFTVLGVGRLHPHKGFDALIDAFRSVPDDWRLEIAGEGPMRPELEEKIREAGLQERVSLLGHREDVTVLLARSHVLVVSSRTEGFSLALLEGLHSCEVVLSTRVGIAEEILPDELLLDIDGIAERLKDVRERHAHYIELTASTRSRLADRFSLARSTERYLDLYERVTRG